MRIANADELVPLTVSEPLQHHLRWGSFSVTGQHPSLQQRPEPRSSIITRFGRLSTLLSCGGAAILLFLGEEYTGLSFRT